MSQPKVTVIQHGDWWAIYLDDRLVWWNKRPTETQILDVLGIEWEAEELDETEVDPETMPRTLTEFRARQKQALRRKLEQEREHLRTRLKSLDEILDKEW